MNKAFWEKKFNSNSEIIIKRFSWSAKIVFCYRFRKNIFKSKFFVLFQEKNMFRLRIWREKKTIFIYSLYAYLSSIFFFTILTYIFSRAFCCCCCFCIQWMWVYVVFITSLRICALMRPFFGAFFFPHRQCKCVYVCLCVCSFGWCAFRTTQSPIHSKIF